jgi:hypothetical protein
MVYEVFTYMIQLAFQIIIFKIILNCCIIYIYILIILIL